jgi:hypothetical protein
VRFRTSEIDAGVLRPHEIVAIMTTCHGRLHLGHRNIIDYCGRLGDAG